MVAVNKLMYVTVSLYAFLYVGKSSVIKQSKQNLTSSLLIFFYPKLGV